MALHYQMAVGLNKGLSVAGGHLTEHTKCMWDMIWEVCSFSPYEQQDKELLKVSRDKWALKKREELSNILVAMRKGAAKKDRALPLCAQYIFPGKKKETCYYKQAQNCPYNLF
ncbi:hypothetical protein JEQ12_009121 [Ovis aries]|uniref:Large ribosomal subunit protein eL36 n=1 Tax=Ovis aries TaxID=9940 RepID=A0A836D6J5_SHEEP|nr:hypothetical protein JEQ12_009121 [Ovis aries]